MGFQEHPPLARAQSVMGLEAHNGVLNQLKNMLTAALPRRLEPNTAVGGTPHRRVCVCV